MCAGLLGLTAGCGGISTGKSISPLDFLIPGGGGLMRGLLYQPPTTLPPPTATPTTTPGSAETAAPVT